MTPSVPPAPPLSMPLMLPAASMMKKSLPALDPVRFSTPENSTTSSMKPESAPLICHTASAARPIRVSLPAPPTTPDTFRAPPVPVAICVARLMTAGD